MQSCPCFKLSSFKELLVLILNLLQHIARKKGDVSIPRAPSVYQNQNKNQFTHAIVTLLFFYQHINSDFYSNKRINLSTKKIVITGGPGTGKSTLINSLIKRGHNCLEEISRQVILEAKKEGIDQLFLIHPLRFSEKLLKGRQKQFIDAEIHTNKTVFFDRGIPDVLAYMDYIGDNYPEHFIEACENAKYHQVFILKPWKAIYTSDNERYESFDQALKIHDYLVNTYQSFNYNLIDVPFGTVENRTDFILNTLDI